jgi:hypothetical protein
MPLIDILKLVRALRDRPRAQSKGLEHVRCVLLARPFSYDHFVGMSMVQTRFSSSPRRLAETVLLCRTQDGVLVRSASMG